MVAAEWEGGSVDRFFPERTVVDIVIAPVE